MVSCLHLSLSLSLSLFLKGVCFPVDVLDTGDGDLGIASRGFEACVSQDFLNIADISPVFEHTNGHGMTKQVTTAFLGDTGLFPVHSDADLEGFGCHGSAMHG